MKLKKGVNPTRLQPELLLSLVVADSVYFDHGQELVITSLNDGRHSETSLHYSGQAADLRTHYFTKQQVTIIAKELRQALGHNPDYDVVIEKDHIHLEWQPKRRT